MTHIQRSIEFSSKFPDIFTNKTQLQRFLGSLNYISPFYKNLSRDLALLYDRLKKDHKKPWTNSLTDLVKTIKKRVKSLPCLTLANPAWPKIVETDESNIGYGDLITTLKEVPLNRDLKELILWKIIDGMDGSSLDNQRLEEKAVILAEGKDHPQVHQDHHTNLHHLEFITQKQGDSFASIAKEEVDDIKTYEKKTLTYREEKNLGRYSRGYNTSENVYNFSKMIIKHVIHIEDWGISSMTERQFSLNKVMVSFTYWDYIHAFNKVLCYNNERHKHTWFIKVCSKIFVNPISNWFLNWWSYHGPTIKILPEPFLKLYKEWVKNSLFHGFINGFRKYISLRNKSLAYTELIIIIFGTGIMTDDSTSVKHMARKISNHDEGEQNKMIMNYLEEVNKKILLNISHYKKLDSSMRSETSEDMHEAQPYEEESPVDALKKAEDFLAKLMDKV
ncbi:hypothetical protein H5410_015389 [Solanum commersonii]|uniref:Uncharacterized protein n=1 Tax=Solanum commersonii TaxID=4109 RepID=A0A9J5ZTD3_SOLCO|nr:hypothetical protein H5410_015389 [Solanum commersonii]